MFQYAPGCGKLIIDGDKITIEKRPFIKKKTLTKNINEIHKIEYMYPNKELKKYGFIKLFYSNNEELPHLYPNVNNDFLYNDLSLVIVYYQFFIKEDFEKAIYELSKVFECPINQVGVETNDSSIYKSNIKPMTQIDLKAYAEYKRITSGENLKEYTDETPNNVPAINNEYSISYNEFNIPNNVVELLWIADGNMQNYQGNRFMQDCKFSCGNFTVSFNKTYSVEPSLISLKLPISTPDTLDNVAKLDYYPTYNDMTPEQRYIYLKWLENPFDEIDIGYVFVFYYGLERHLIEGNFEKAFDMILQLRKYHKNGSFQSYSFNALLLSSMLNRDYDSFEKLNETITNIAKVDISIYIAVKKFFGLTLSCEEIIALANKVKFQNKRYIKNNYSEFIITLQSIIEEKYGANCIDLSLFDNSKCETSCTCYIANTSFDYHIRECHFPDLLKSNEFKETIYNLLLSTHEKVKSDLAEQRKKK